jgi:hypothetical protein
MKWKVETEEKEDGCSKVDVLLRTGKKYTSTKREPVQADGLN